MRLWFKRRIFGDFSEARSRNVINENEGHYTGGEAKIKYIEIEEK